MFLLRTGTYWERGPEGCSFCIPVVTVLSRAAGCLECWVFSAGKGAKSSLLHLAEVTELPDHTVSHTRVPFLSVEGEPQETAARHILAD